MVPHRQLYCFDALGGRSVAATLFASFPSKGLQTRRPESFLPLTHTSSGAFPLLLVAVVNYIHHLSLRALRTFSSHPSLRSTACAALAKGGCADDGHGLCLGWVFL